MTDSRGARRGFIGWACARGPCCCEALPLRRPFAPDKTGKEKKHCPLEVFVSTYLYLCNTVREYKISNKDTL